MSLRNKFALSQAIYYILNNPKLYIKHQNQIPLYLLIAISAGHHVLLFMDILWPLSYLPFKSTFSSMEFIVLYQKDNMDIYMMRTVYPG